MPYYNKLLILLIVPILSCCTKEKTTKADERIFYTFNTEITTSLLKTYNSDYKDKKSPYVTFNFCDEAKRKIVLNPCGACDFGDVVKKTNRFVKLNGETLIPVMLTVDYSYVEGNEKQLKNSTGGETVFVIDGNDHITETYTGM
jgi:hypothetical protein